MGIEFIAKKGKQYENQRDAAYEDQLASENLFSNLPDKILPTFRCRLTGDSLPSIGDGVLLDGTAVNIKVILLNKVIGTIMSPDSSAARALMEQLNNTALVGTICEIQPLAKIAVIRVKT